MIIYFSSHKLSFHKPTVELLKPAAVDVNLNASSCH